MIRDIDSESRIEAILSGMATPKISGRLARHLVHRMRTNSRSQAPHRSCEIDWGLRLNRRPDRARDNLRWAGERHGAGREWWPLPLKRRGRPGRDQSWLWWS